MKEVDITSSFLKYIPKRSIQYRLSYIIANRQGGIPIEEVIPKNE